MQLHARAMTPFSATLFAHAVVRRVNQWIPPGVRLPLFNKHLIPFSPVIKSWWEAIIPRPSHLHR
jgi:hypothetical protein